MTIQNQPAAGTQSRWVFDPFHTQVEFVAKHLSMMTVRGNFPELTATGCIDPDRPEASSVEVTIQTASLRTHNPQRDNDLRSSNFKDLLDGLDLTQTSPESLSKLVFDRLSVEEDEARYHTRIEMARLGMINP